MASSTGSGWAQLRQQARSLETQTETLFHSYSQLSQTPNIPPTPTEEEQKLESQLEDLLERREKLIAQLTRLLTSEPAATTSALKSSNLTRHRSLLTSDTAELSRQRTTLSTARTRANLISNIHDDINAYRASNPEAAEADYMLDERRRIEESHGVVDNVLAQAYAVNEGFGVQREMLAGVQRRIGQAAGKVPGINGLIGRIGAKRRRDGFILVGPVFSLPPFYRMGFGTGCVVLRWS
ncbi:MAG: hypothetical protein HETSPECPRED_009181 [Heterodermia speciosa]|uniref:Golgi SNAP receptor complex member 1 n=1 Tax=Heterodermia speciosa TaxID=116794 RepID=A0A8H3IYL1_9LECA|nr:MAG: hypothetical protein HETSPECPRED_009181 [Heterodermia speciosa]